MEMNRKGVTPVIATVLLITIAIASVSTAAVFFSEIAEQITQNVEDDLSQQERVDRSQITIETGFEDNGDIILDIRNTGSIAMPVRGSNDDRWSIFLDSRPVDRENGEWDYYDTSIGNEEDYYIDPQETIRLRIIDEFPDSGGSVIIETNAPYESGSTILCDDSGDQRC